MENEKNMENETLFRDCFAIINRFVEKHAQQSTQKMPDSNNVLFEGIKLYRNLLAAKAITLRKAQDNIQNGVNIIREDKKSTLYNKSYAEIIQKEILNQINKRREQEDSLYFEKLLKMQQAIGESFKKNEHNISK